MCVCVTVCVCVCVRERESEHAPHPGSLSHAPGLQAAWRADGYAAVWLQTLRTPQSTPHAMTDGQV